MPYTDGMLEPPGRPVCRQAGLSAGRQARILMKSIQHLIALLLVLCLVLDPSARAFAAFDPSPSRLSEATSPCVTDIFQQQAIVESLAAFAHPISKTTLKILRLAGDLWRGGQARNYPAVTRDEAD